jgi:hypothetical protein
MNYAQSQLTRENFSRSTVEVGADSKLCQMGRGFNYYVYYTISTVLYNWDKIKSSFTNEPR